MSIEKVAKIAGVSHATVSRVINRQPGVSAERAEMVREVMNRLAYTPKPRSKRTGPAPRTTDGARRPRTLDMFALIAPELDRGLYPALQRGFSDASAERGLQVIASHTDNDVYKQADLIIQLIDKGIAGVALVPASQGISPAHHVRHLQQQGIPVVLLHRPVAGVNAPLITLPAEQIGRKAGERIVKAGHKRVAFLSTQRSGVAEQYEHGFRQALEAAGVTLPDAWVDYARVDATTAAAYEDYRSHAAQVLKGFLSGPEAPTAVFSSVESAAEILYLEALRMGLSVPSDLSIVTVGGTQRTSAISQCLTAVVVDEARAGHDAARLLDEMVNGQRPHDDIESFPATIAFDEGETLGPPPSKQ
ncbi:MAG: LacI family DNA-binding transcriptional regulator [Phycisphaeraceae bacterium]